MDSGRRDADEPSPHGGGRIPTRAEIAAEYLAASGRSGRTLGFWHTLGLWKIAIIAEGIRRRVSENPENAAAHGVPTARDIQELIDQGWAVARESGLAS